jgi:hypothetical protein
MKLSKYFEKRDGHGVIATADSKGKVGAAVYARPHFISEKTVAFVMADRLMHKNLQSNPHASYLFVESDKEDAGKRIYLTKTKEEADRKLVDEMLRKGVCPVDEGYVKGKRYLVYFKIDKVLPLVGVREKKRLSVSQAAA